MIKKNNDMEGIKKKKKSKNIATIYMVIQNDHVFFSQGF
jgi:hypothetical protein